MPHPFMGHGRAGPGVGPHRAGLRWKRELCRLLGHGDRVAERLDPVLEPLRLDGRIVSALEVRRTGVVVEGTVGEQVPGRRQDGVGDGDGGLVGPAPPGDPRVLGREVAALGPCRRPAASMSARCSQVEPCRVPAGRRLPADSWLAGATPAQAQRCPGVGNRVMSTPISAIITSAVVLETPVIEHKMVTADSKGATRSVISAVSVAMEASRKSMWSMMAAHQRVVGAEVPENASSSAGILARSATWPSGRGPWGPARRRSSPRSSAATTSTTPPRRPRSA